LFSFREKEDAVKNTKLLALVILLASILAIVVGFWDSVTMVAVAGVAAYLLTPLVRLLRKRLRLPKIIAVALVMLSLVGIVAGIFGIAKLIEILMKKWKGRTYCAILGMVLASPVAILMDTSIYKGFSLWICVASVVALAAGALIAFKLGGDPEPKKA